MFAGTLTDEEGVMSQHDFPQFFRFSPFPTLILEILYPDQVRNGQKQEYKEFRDITGYDPVILEK